MQSPFDTLAKGLIDAGLEPFCAVSIQEPVAMDTLYADTLVEPYPNAATALSQRGLLGRMALSPCVMEPFALTPSVATLDRCMARASMLRVQREQALVLWVISPGVPRAAVDAWELVRGASWGGGIYLSTVTRAPRVVVVAELPRTRDTMLLRLMGRGKVLRHALEDFEALPRDAWERAFVPRLLLRVRGELARMGASAPLSEEIRMRYREIVEETDRVMEALRAEGEARGRARGRIEGRVEGRVEGEARGRAAALREAVLAMCEVLGVSLDDARREQIATADADALAAMLDTLRHTRAMP